METEELARLLPLLAPLIVIQLGLIVAALVDLIRRQSTRGPKWAWGIAIVAFSILGPLAYFIFGRGEE
ncbi:MAG: PLD nuclease N-terminal domain-containing protein [Chloroflexi bacterium]|jgi:hypothetical protein|nr:PLD nuclease N-terminal domain-containing protein [Chloroflexota bacterium]